MTLLTALKVFIMITVAPAAILLALIGLLLAMLEELCEAIWWAFKK